MPPAACHIGVVESVAAALVMTGIEPPLPRAPPARRADGGGGGGGGGHGPAAEAAERRESGLQIENPFVVKGRAATIPLVPVPRGCPVVVANANDDDDDDRQTPERGNSSGDQDAVAHALLGSNNDPFM
jgi:hypothetical protein